LTKNPKQAGFQYNLGNGFVALAEQEPYSGYDWYLTTAATRRKARSHFQQAISSDRDQSIASVALTNLGNALSKAHRWVEAYDAYARVLGHDGSNAMASTGAAKIFLRSMERGIGDRRVLQSVAARHLDRARLHPERISELAGARAHEQLSFWKRNSKAATHLISARPASTKFVARHRLALSPTIEAFSSHAHTAVQLKRNWCPSLIVGIGFLLRRLL
jgi:tetratricopeptide (TPR) repeat protein